MKLHIREYKIITIAGLEGETVFVFKD